jgi:oxygen-independent coproporphyrinogen III oxidase
VTDALGLYVSIPFCKAKCSFCNFASGVFAAERLQSYVDRVCTEIAAAQACADRLGVPLPMHADSIYLGGGTPSLLSPELMRQLFAALQSHFAIDADAEVTVECAPGQLSPETLQAMLAAGVNRLSFGVQSFIDRECAAVGRLHTGAQARAQLRSVAEAGVKRIGIDLIAGLPHQSFDSWRETVQQAIDSGVEHVSVYMLEVDEDSRLGREFLRGGTRFGAGALPPDDRVADWYSAACEWLDAGGIRQYEISNFARAGGQSRHNRKYWERLPYLGFGMDAHSMLRDGAGGVRWANADEMPAYLNGNPPTTERVNNEQAFEESAFLGLRLVEGISLPGLRAEFGCALVDSMMDGLRESQDAGLIVIEADRLKLTNRGRMISNEVFERLLCTAV